MLARLRAIVDRLSDNEEVLALDGYREGDCLTVARALIDHLGEGTLGLIAEPRQRYDGYAHFFAKIGEYAMDGRFVGTAEELIDDIIIEKMEQGKYFQNCPKVYKVHKTDIDAVPFNQSVYDNARALIRGM